MNLKVSKRSGNFLLLIATFALVASGFLVGVLVPRLGNAQVGYLVVFSILFPILTLLFAKGTSETRYYAMVFFLPFTQALSVKLGARWNPGELLAWMIAPSLFSGMGAGRGLGNKTPFWVSVSIVIYSLAISLISLILIVPRYPWLPSSVYYYISPALRTVVENARLLAGIVAFLAPLYFIRNEQNLMKTLRVFGLSGIVASLYGIYQGIHVLWAQWLPLLPGTLWQEGASFRLWGTFYEPTGYGSFCLLGAIIIAFLYMNDVAYRRWWFIGLFVTILGVILSVATTAWIAGLIALASLLGTTGLSRRRSSGLVSLLIIGIVTATLLLLLQQVFNLREIFWRNLYQGYVEYRLRSSMDPDRAIRWLAISPLGVGQGLLAFFEGGAPGILRWVTEMGIPGILLLLVLHWEIWKAISAMFRQKGLINIFGPFAVALYFSTAIIFLRYLNVTHIWLWFSMGLPLVSYNFKRMAEKVSPEGMSQSVAR